VGRRARRSASVELVGRCGGLIGEMLSTAVHFLNPALVVLGGRVAQSSDVLLAAIRQTVYAKSLPFATRRLEITNAQLGADGGVIGVATMVVDELLSGPLRRMDAVRRAGRPAGYRRSGRLTRLVPASSAAEALLAVRKRTPLNRS